MEAPPFARLLKLRAERAALADRDKQLQAQEDAEMAHLAAQFSHAEIAAALGDISPQRVGQRIRRPVDDASLTQLDRLGRAVGRTSGYRHRT